MPDSGVKRPRVCDFWTLWTVEVPVAMLAGACIPCEDALLIMTQTNKLPFFKSPSHIFNGSSYIIKPIFDTENTGIDQMVSQHSETRHKCLSKFVFSSWCFLKKKVRRVPSGLLRDSLQLDVNLLFSSSLLQIPWWKLYEFFHYTGILGCVYNDCKKLIQLLLTGNITEVVNEI